MAILDTTAVEDLLRHYNVAGVSFATIQSNTVNSQAVGLASRASPNVPLDTSHALEICSLSKTLGAAFMLEYFTAKGISAETKVNALLRQAGCKFQLKSQPGSPPEWAEEVSLRQLVDHSSLGMHYVNGVPLSKPMPPVEALLSGSPENPAPYGYACLDLTKKPGSSFHYSGGGFLVLQLLLEYLEGKGIADIMDPFVAASGPSVSKQMSFHQDLPSMKYATGYKEGDTGPVEDGRLMFPALAAGGLATPSGLAEWLRQLAVAYHAPAGCGPISHATARAMLTPGPDIGSEAFMRARMGMGVFVFSAGTPGSKWMLHQAANDGFRGVYLVCFDGPDATEGPRGFVVLANGDNNAMFLICAVMRMLLQCEALNQPKLRGLDWARVPSMEGFSTEGLKQEEIVNLGIKELVLNAFTPTQPTPKAKL